MNTYLLIPALTTEDPFLAKSRESQEVGKTLQIRQPRASQNKYKASEKLQIDPQLI